MVGYCIHALILKKIKKHLVNQRKRATIRTSNNYRCLPGKGEPAFVGLAESPGSSLQGLQYPPHKRHGFRIFAHNPEVSGSNPLPATETDPSERADFSLR